MRNVSKRVLVLVLALALLLPMGANINVNYAEKSFYVYPSSDNSQEGSIDFDQKTGIYYINEFKESFDFKGGNIKSYLVYDKDNKVIENTNVKDADHITFKLVSNGSVVDETYKIVVVKNLATFKTSRPFSSYNQFGNAMQMITMGTTFEQLFDAVNFREGVTAELRTKDGTLTEFGNLLVEEHINDLYFLADGLEFKVTLGMNIKLVVNDSDFTYISRGQLFELPYPMSQGELEVILKSWNPLLESIEITTPNDENLMINKTKSELGKITFKGGTSEFTYFVANGTPVIKGSKGLFGFDFTNKTCFVDRYAPELIFDNTELMNVTAYDADGNIVLNGNNQAMTEEITTKIDKIIVTMPKGYKISFNPSMVEVSKKPEEPKEEVKEEAKEEVKEEVVATVEFNDLETAWAKKEIGVLAGKGIISGMGDGSFNPNGKLTRAAFAKMLIKSLDLTSDNTENYADVEESNWFNDIARVSKGLGLTKDTENFNGNENLSREEMAYMAAKALAFEAIDKKSDFTDYDSIAPWACDAVDFLVDKGYINGSEQEDGTFKFNPNNELTRQESVKVIYNLLDL